MSPESSNSSGRHGNQALENTARESKNAGGGAILIFLGNYIITFIGISI
jgi:hypothetical protein